jgi:hypothetical protein
MKNTEIQLQKVEKKLLKAMSEIDNAVFEMSLIQKLNIEKEAIEVYKAKKILKKILKKTFDDLAVRKWKAKQKI